MVITVCSLSLSIILSNVPFFKDSSHLDNCWVSFSSFKPSLCLSPTSFLLFLEGAPLSLLVLILLLIWTLVPELLSPLYELYV